MKQETYKNYVDAVKALKNLQKTLGGKFIYRPDLKCIDGRLLFKKSYRSNKIPHWGYLLCKNQDIIISIKLIDNDIYKIFYLDIKQVA